VEGLTVIVPATDRPATLPACLAAVRAADAGPDEILVVDEPVGAGPARARNLGAARARGELLCFVDADVEVHADAFVRLRAAFAGAPGLVAAFGAYDDTPAAPGVVSGFRNLLHHHVHVAGAGPAQTFWAGLGAVRRDAFAAAGGFDAARFPRSSVEDIDLGMRLAGAGARIVLDPSIQGTHLKAWTLPSMLRTDFARRGVPWVVLLLEAGPDASRAGLNLGWRHRVSAAASVAAAGAALARRPLAALSALAVLAWLNRGLYALLARRRGVGAAGLGVGLHVLHHLAGAAAVPVGAAAHLRRARARAVNDGHRGVSSTARGATMATRREKPLA
jgi:GT2 family glycosyltransferase